MVSSTEGSLIRTGWNRRSRAASFSIFFRYSLSVVAPMHAKLAPGQGRLEHVRGVDGAFGRARAHEGMDLVDEEDDLPRSLGHFLENSLQPILELAAEFGAGDKRPHIQGDDPLVLECLRYVAVDDPLGEPLHDGRLADARLADQHGVVLRPPREDLHDPSDLLVAADDRVKGALSCQLIEIPRVSLKGLVFFLGVLVRDALAAPDVHQNLVDAVFRDAGRS